jgi:hypothetical protein
LLRFRQEQRHAADEVPARPLIGTSLRATFIRMSTPRSLANRMASRGRRGDDDGFHRETFRLPREQARLKAKEQFARFPSAAYMTKIESWRVLPGDEIEFTMRRLRSAD